MAKLNTHQLQHAVRDAAAVVYAVTEGVWRFIDEYKTLPLCDKTVSAGLFRASNALFDLMQAEELDLDEVPGAVYLYHLAARSTITFLQSQHGKFPGPIMTCRGLKSAADRLLEVTNAWYDAELESSRVTKEVA